MSLLCGWLKTNSTLISLDLRDTGMQSVGAAALVIALLKHNTADDDADTDGQSWSSSVTSLDVSRNQLGKEGAAGKWKWKRNSPSPEREWEWGVGSGK